MNKQTLRQKYLQKRKNLSSRQRETLSLEICDKFFRLPNITDYCVFHIYLPIIRHGEINTFPIIDRLRESGKTIVVPKMNQGEPGMDTCLIHPGSTLKANGYGVPEPADCRQFPAGDIEVVILPLLAYDEEGYRLGYGKGYYDRFLSKLPKPVFKVGLSFFDPIPEKIPRNPWDISMDGCVTPEKIIRF